MMPRDASLLDSCTFDHCSFSSLGIEKSFLNQVKLHQIWIVEPFSYRFSTKRNLRLVLKLSEKGNNTFPIDLTPNGLPFEAKFIGKLQSKFGCSELFCVKFIRPVTILPSDSNFFIFPFEKIWGSIENMKEHGCLLNMPILHSSILLIKNITYIYLSV